MKQSRGNKFEKLIERLSLSSSESLSDEHGRSSKRSKHDANSNGNGVTAFAGPFGVPYTQNDHLGHLASDGSKDKASSNAGKRTLLCNFVLRNQIQLEESPKENSSNERS